MSRKSTMTSSSSSTSFKSRPKQQVMKGSRLEYFLTIVFFYLSLWLLVIAFLPQIPTKYHLFIKTVILR